MSRLHHEGLVAPWFARLVALDPRVRAPIDGVKDSDERWVGVPGMSALARGLARDLDVRPAARIVALEGDRGVAFTEEEASGWLSGEGFSVTARYGVRAFADCVPAARLEDAAFFDALLDLELAAASLAPYRSMARYVHLIANKEVEIS